MQCIMLTNAEYCRYLYMFVHFLFMLCDDFADEAHQEGRNRWQIWYRHWTIFTHSFAVSCSYHCILVDNSFVIAVT
jgi:hypothetical protein